MRTGIMLLGFTMLLLSACDGIPQNYAQGDTSSGGLSGSYGPTSYRTGYGVRSTIRGVADSQMDWGE